MFAFQPSIATRRLGERRFGGELTSQKLGPAHDDFSEAWRKIYGYHSANGEAIVDAALAVARRKGLAPTTVRDVALEMGTSSGLIHHYFESMDHVLAALADGSLLVDPIVTHEFKSAQAIEAFDLAKDPTKSGKVLISFRDQ